MAIRSFLDEGEDQLPARVVCSRCGLEQPLTMDCADCGEAIEPGRREPDPSPPPASAVAGGMEEEVGGEIYLGPAAADPNLIPLVASDPPAQGGYRRKDHFGIVGTALWATASAVMYYRLRSLKMGVPVWKLSSATD